MTPDKIRMSGIIVDVLPSDKFKVKLANGVEIMAYISGKIRVHKIRILPGDKVEVELSTYDLTKGRIVYRH